MWCVGNSSVYVCACVFPFFAFCWCERHSKEPGVSSPLPSGHGAACHQLSQCLRWKLSATNILFTSLNTFSLESPWDPHTFSDPPLCACLRWNDTACSGRNLCYGLFGAPELYNWQRVVNVLLAWKLQPPCPLEKVGAAPLPFLSTFRVNTHATVSGAWRLHCGYDGPQGVVPATTGVGKGWL